MGCCKMVLILSLVLLFFFHEIQLQQASEPTVDKSPASSAIVSDQKVARLSSSTKLETKLIERLLHKWNRSRCVGPDHEPRELVALTMEGTEASLNYLGLDENKFDSYGIQIGNKSHSAVHLRPEQRIHGFLIYSAFRMSARHQAHAFLTFANETSRLIRVPNDGLSYENRLISCIDFTEPVCVWSTEQALNDLDTHMDKLCRIYF